MLRDIDYWRRRTRICSCEAKTKFAPLSRSDHFCSACDPGLRAHTGPCALAFAHNPHEGRYVHPALPVCVACARNPELRGRLIKALEHGQAARRAANAQPTPEATP